MTRASWPALSTQEAIWLFQALAPREPLTVTFRADLPRGTDDEVVSEAWRALANRHEGLRTVFRVEPAGLRQLVLDPTEVPVRLVPLTVAPGEDGHVPAPQPLDPLAGGDLPAWRLGLHRGRDGAVRLFMEAHHLLSDPVGLQNLADELRILTAQAGRHTDTSGLPAMLQPRQLAAWEHSPDGAAELRRNLQKWRHDLRGLRGPGWPSTGGVPLHRSEGLVCRFTLSPETAAGLRRAARSARATPFMVFAAVLFAALARFTGHADLTIQAPFHNRRQRQMWETVGTLVQPVLLRHRVADVPFQQLVEEVRRLCLGGWERAAYRFADLWGWMYEDMLQSGAGFAAVAAQMEFDVPQERLDKRPSPAEAPPLSTHRDDAGSGAFRTGSLLLYVTSLPEGVRCALWSNTAYTDAATLERFADELIAVCESVAADPAGRLTRGAPLRDAAFRADGTDVEAVLRRSLGEGCALLTREGDGGGRSVLHVRCGVFRYARDLRTSLCLLQASHPDLAVPDVIHIVDVLPDARCGCADLAEPTPEIWVGTTVDTVGGDIGGADGAILDRVAEVLAAGGHGEAESFTTLTGGLSTLPAVLGRLPDGCPAPPALVNNLLHPFSLAWCASAAGIRAEAPRG